MPIQDFSSSRSFYSTQPYWYSRKDTPIWGIHAWHLLIKCSKRFFYQLYSNYGRKFAQSPSLVTSTFFWKYVSRWTNSKLFKAFDSFSETIQWLYQFSKIQTLHGLSSRLMQKPSMVIWSEVNLPWQDTPLQSQMVVESASLAVRRWILCLRVTLLHIKTQSHSQLFMYNIWTTVLVTLFYTIFSFV